jgi:hypothetical protein
MKATGWLIAFLLSILVALVNLAAAASGFNLVIIALDLAALCAYTCLYVFYGPPRQQTLARWIPLKNKLRPWVLSLFLGLGAIGMLYIGASGIATHSCELYTPGHTTRNRWLGNLFIVNASNLALGSWAYFLFALASMRSFISVHCGVKTPNKSFKPNPLRGSA